MTELLKNGATLRRDSKNSLRKVRVVALYICDQREFQLLGGRHGDKWEINITEEVKQEAWVEMQILYADIKARS